MDSILDEKSFRLESVRALNKQVVHLVFKDGKEFDLDLSPDLNSFQGPFVEPLKDQSVFSRVRVDYGSLVFPTGLDMEGMFYGYGVNMAEWLILKRQMNLQKNTDHRLFF